MPAEVPQLSISLITRWNQCGPSDVSVPDTPGPDITGRLGSMDASGSLLDSRKPQFESFKFKVLNRVFSFKDLNQVFEEGLDLVLFLGNQTE